MFIFMRIFQRIESYLNEGPVVLSIGNFDGLHRGHQYLLQKNLDLATKKVARSVVLSFSPHPMQLLKPDSFISLGTVSDQEMLLEQMGIDHWIIEPFSQATKDETADAFFARILKYIPVCGIVVGPDFQFGKNRQGDVNFLKALGVSKGIEVLIPDAYLYHGQRVSSTQIRQLLQQGNVEMASDLLGRPFSVHGRVVSGFRRGHQIGFPTANITSSSARNLRRGVYVTVVSAFGKKWKAATNVGLHPTFGEEVELKIESHLLDFNQNLYGEEIQIEFHRFLRPENKFGGVDELVSQIQKDIKEVREHGI
ncbi:MAG: putative riboflavin kinase/FMN adenylyltransferase [Pseudomonadota bacterium]|jgi:riboflavin kinase/FMN adenylyltransferase